MSKTMDLISSVIGAILLVLSLFSFFPQFGRILRKGESSGISLYYVFFNLVVATEQFAMNLHCIVDSKVIPNYIVQRPFKWGDWLNFSQFTTVWICHLILFVFCLWYPPHRRGLKYALVVMYIVFLLISVAPVIVENTLPTGTSRLEEEWFAAFYAGLHMFMVHPIVTVLGLFSFVPQIRETRFRGSSGALSIRGVSLQAILFTIVAVWWALRFSLDSDFRRMSPWRYLITWYQLVGWAAVDNAVFAFTQFVVLWVASGQTGRLGIRSFDGETTPLLRT